MIACGSGGKPGERAVNEIPWAFNEHNAQSNHFIVILKPNDLATAFRLVLLIAVDNFKAGKSQGL